MAAAAALVALVVGTVAVSVLVPKERSEVVAEEADPAGGWQPEVAELATFVEEARGLAFDEPVAVRFLSDDDYREAVDDRAGRAAAGDADRLEHRVGLLRALGLVEGPVDLEEATAELVADGTLGWYDPATGEVSIRGEEMTVDVRATVVHELTHALQHQHFPELFAGRPSNEGEAFAIDALTEGDAIRMEYAYVDSLPEEEWAELEEIYAEAVDDGAIDEAFERPPTTDEQVMDPFRHLEPDEPPVLTAPAAPAGADVVEESELGAVGWLVMLAERIDPFAALDAVDGWGRDAYTLYESGGRLCAAVTVAGDTAADTNELHEALVAWAAEVPTVAPAVGRTAAAVSLRVCDPGTGADLDLTGRGARSLVVPAARSFMAAGEIAFGTPLDEARCLADELVRRYTLAELEDVDVPDDADARFDGAAAACRVA